MSNTPARSRRSKAAAAALALAVPITAGCAATGIAIAVSGAASAGPVAVTLSPSAFTNDGTPDFAGTGTPGDQVSVLLDSSSVNVPTPYNKFFPIDAGGNWSGTWDNGPLLDGTYTYEVYAPGGSTVNGSFTLDRVAPTVTLPTVPAVVTSATTATFTANESVTWNIAIDGVAEIVSSGPSAAVELTGRPNGAHILTVVATDAAGNASQQQTLNYTLDSGDSTGPVLNPYLTPGENSGRWAVFAWEADEPVAEWYYALDNDPEIPFPSDSVAPGHLRLNSITAGAHHIDIRTVDANGNESHWTHDWTATTQPDSPAVELTQTSGPSAGEATGPNVTFSFTADQPVAAWTWSLDGDPDRATKTPGTISFEGLAEGSHVLTVNVYELDGAMGGKTFNFNVSDAPSGEPTPTPTPTDNPTPDPTDDPTDTPLAIKGYAGQSVNFSVAHFEGGEQYVVLLDKTDPDTVPVADGEASAEGGPTVVSVPLPVDITLGNHTLYVLGSLGTVVEQPLVVEAAPTPEPTTPTPEPTDKPTDGSDKATVYAPGEEVPVSGRGFTAGETVEVWLHSTPQLIGTVTASEVGMVATTVKLPTDLEAGAHQIILKGLTSGVEVATDITVTGAAPSAGGPSGRLPISGGDPTALGLMTGGLTALGMAALWVARRRSAPQH